MERLFCFGVPETRERRRYRGVHGVFSLVWRVFVCVFRMTPLAFPVSLTPWVHHREPTFWTTTTTRGFFLFWLDAPPFTRTSTRRYFCLGSSSNQPASQQQQQHFLWTEIIPPPSPCLFCLSQSYLIPRFFFLHPHHSRFGFFDTSSWTHADAADTISHRQTRVEIRVAERGWDGT